MEAHDPPEPGQPAGVEVEAAAAQLQVHLREAQVDVDMAQFARTRARVRCAARAGPRRRRGAARYLIHRSRVGAGRQGGEAPEAREGIELAVQRAGLDQEAGEWGVGHEVEPEREPCEFAPAGVGFVQGRPPHAQPRQVQHVEQEEEPAAAGVEVDLGLRRLHRGCRPAGDLAGGACTGRRRGAFGFGGGREDRPPTAAGRVERSGRSGAGEVSSELVVLRLHGGGRSRPCARGRAAPDSRAAGVPGPCLPPIPAMAFRLGAQDVPAARPARQQGGALRHMSAGPRTMRGSLAGSLPTRAAAPDGATGRVESTLVLAGSAGRRGGGPLAGSSPGLRRMGVSIPARAPRRPPPAPPRGCRARPGDDAVPAGCSRSEAAGWQLRQRPRRQHSDGRDSCNAEVPSRAGSARASSPSSSASAAAGVGRASRAAR